VTIPDDWPPRGTPPYRDLITRITEVTDLTEAGLCIVALLDHYGYRAVLDLMVEWIEIGEYLVPDQFRLPDGTINADVMVPPDRDAFTLKVATARSAETPPDQAHQRFADTLDTLSFLETCYDGWKPALYSAFQAARQRDRAGIRAALARGPGLRSDDYRVHRAMAMYTACLAIPFIAHAHDQGLSPRPSTDRPLTTPDFSMSLELP
jgi:hypothetical protein